MLQSLYIWLNRSQLGSLATSVLSIVWSSWNSQLQRKAKGFHITVKFPKGNLGLQLHPCILYCPILQSLSECNILKWPSTSVHGSFGAWPMKFHNSPYTHKVHYSIANFITTKICYKFQKFCLKHLSLTVNTISESVHFSESQLK